MGAPGALWRPLAGVRGRRGLVLLWSLWSLWRPLGRSGRSGRPWGAVGRGAGSTRGIQRVHGRSPCGWAGLRRRRSGGAGQGGRSGAAARLQKGRGRLRAGHWGACG